MRSNADAKRGMAPPCAWPLQFIFAASYCGTAFSLIVWCCAQTCLVWGVIWLIQVSICLAERRYRLIPNVLINVDM